MSPNEIEQLKTGVVNIHKMVELRKLHLRKQNACKMGGNCRSFCQDLGLQKEAMQLLRKYPIL
jgi:hypothetical protein